MADVFNLGKLIADIRSEHEKRAAEEGLTLEQYETRERLKAADEERARLELADRRHRAARLAESGIGITPEDFANIIDDRINPTPPLKHVRWWAEAIKGQKACPRILVLLGGIGCGKTVASAWAVAAIGGGGLRAPELPQTVFPWRGEKATVDLRHRGVVVLDDLGTEITDQRYHQALGAFIDLRVSRGWTIITSNLTRAEFRARYDERVISRLNHVGRSVELATAPSLRRNEGGL